MEKRKPITVDSNIMEVVHSHPGAAEVFMKYGLPCVGCAAAHYEKISDVIAEFGVKEEELIEDLNRLAS